MIKNDNKKIDSVSFWKRDPRSVGRIQNITIKLDEEGNGLYTIDKSGKKSEGCYSPEKTEETIDFLFKEVKIEKNLKDYQAFSYEDSKENYAISFFLRVDYKDLTYLAIKGTNPAKEPHYKDIVSHFEKLISNKD